MYVVYKHTTPSGKVYIGITGQKPEKRWKNGNGYKNNEHFYRAILKYGWENIKHEIVCTGLSRWQACRVEQSLIKYFDSTNPDKGYNHSIGGECGKLGAHPSAETRQKLSESLKGQNYGKHLSAETRRKISEARKGKAAKAVICVETGILYGSGTEAAESIGVTQRAISNVLCGVTKTSGGYHWEYAGGEQ